MLGAVRKNDNDNENKQALFSLPRNLTRAKLEKSSDSWISILILMLGNLTNFIYEIKEILYTDESFTVKFTIRFIFIIDCHGS